MTDTIEFRTKCGLRVTYELPWSQKNTLRLKFMRLDHAHNGNGRRDPDGKVYTVECGFNGNGVEKWTKYLSPPCLKDTLERVGPELAEKGLTPETEGECVCRFGSERVG